MILSSIVKILRSGICIWFQSLPHHRSRVHLTVQWLVVGQLTILCPRRPTKELNGKVSEGDKQFWKSSIYSWLAFPSSLQFFNEKYTCPESLQVTHCRGKERDEGKQSFVPVLFGDEDYDQTTTYAHYLLFSIVTILTWILDTDLTR